MPPKEEAQKLAKRILQDLHTVQTSAQANTQIIKLAKRISQDLDGGQTKTQIIEQLCHEMLISYSDIKEELLQDLAEEQPDVVAACREPNSELSAAIDAYCVAEAEQEETIVRTIIAKLIDLSAEINVHKKNIEQNNANKTRSKQQYYEKYGWKGIVGRNWHEFQPAIDKAEDDITRHQQQIEQLQSVMDIGLAKLAVHYDETIHPEDKVAHQQILDFFDIEFDPNGKLRSMLADLRDTIDSFDVIQVRTKILQEIAKWDGYDLVVHNETVQKLILQWVTSSCNIINCSKRIEQLKQQPDELESITEAQQELEEYQTEIKNFSSNIKAQIVKTKLEHEFTREFQDSFGHELITDDEWQKALSSMLAAQFMANNEAADTANKEKLISMQKVKLAELIIERLPYKEEFHAALGGWQKNSAGANDYVFAIADEVIQKNWQLHIQKIYGYQQLSADKLKEQDWVLLNTGISKRLAKYSSVSVYKNSKVDIEECINNLKNLTMANANNFNEAVDLLHNEIQNIETEKVAVIKNLCTEHDKQLNNLLKKYHQEKWSILQGRWWQDSTYKLAYLDLNEPKEFKEAADALLAKLHADVNKVNTQEKYALNQQYAENIELFGLERFVGKSQLSTVKLIEAFKEQVQRNYQRIQVLTTKLTDINSEIKEMEYRLNASRTEHQQLNRELLELTTNVTKEIVAENKTKINKINEQLKCINGQQQADIIKLQELFSKEIQCKRKLRQMRAKIELEKRQAMGTVPPAHKDFLQDYKDFLAINRKKSLEDFSQTMQQLANTRDKASLNKLFALSAEVINILPYLDMPDIAGKNGLQHSYTNINDIVKSFIILDQAKKAAEIASSNDPSNLYLLGLAEDIKQAFAILANKILVHPVQEAIIGFELLPEDLQVEYIKQAATINTTTKNGRKQAEKLNKQIWHKINNIQFEKVQQEFDQQLAQMGKIGEWLKKPDNVELYNGLINNQIVLNELLTMQKRLENYLITVADELKKNANINPAEKAAKEKEQQKKEQELIELQDEIHDMQKIMATDLKRIYDLLGLAVNMQDMITFINQEAQHYCTRAAYIAGGAIAGYGIGKAAGMVCGLLGNLTGYSALNFAASSTPYVGIAGGFLVGNEAGKLATQYDDYNIDRVLSKADADEIKERDKTFASPSFNYSAIEKKFDKIKKNYIDGFTNVKSGFIATIANFIGKHKFLFWAAVLGLGIFAGVTISAATMGVAAPFVALIGTGIVAGIYGGGFAVGMLGTVSIGAWIHNKIRSSPVKRIYNNAVSLFNKANKKIEIKINKLKNIEQDADLSNLIKRMNKHFIEQMKLIRARIKECDPRLIDQNDDEQKKVFESKLMRELYCLENMLEVREKLMEILIEINENKAANPTLVVTKQAELKELLDTYLNDNYNAYHKTHMVDIAVQHTIQAKTDLGQHMKDKGRTRLVDMLRKSRRHYITEQFSGSQEQERIAKAKAKEKEIVASMKDIKGQIAKIYSPAPPTAHE